MRKLIFAFAVLISAACTHQPTKAPISSNLIYPYGTYQHKVNINVIQPPRTMSMRGVIQSQPNQLKVIGLSTFNTTVFRIDEDLKTGNITKEFYVDALKQNEEKFMFFYRLLRELVLAEKGKTEFEKDGAKFKLSQPDSNHIYRMIDIEHPQVHLNVEVSDYRFF